jgi:hypothetical protein
MSRISTKLIFSIIFMNLIFQSNSAEDNSQLIDYLTISISKDEIYIDDVFEIFSNEKKELRKDKPEYIDKNEQS